MNWLRNFLAQLDETRELRDGAVTAATAQRDARIEAGVLRVERDTARGRLKEAIAERDASRKACDALADTNVLLAHQLEQAEATAAQWRARWADT